jgi:hypothetical protein
MTGCASTVIEAGGAKFSMSGSEADLAHSYERAEPQAGRVVAKREQNGDVHQASVSVAQSRCDYWSARATVVMGEHEALGGMVKVNGHGVMTKDHSDGLIAWAQARQGEACAEAAAEAKKAAEEYAAGEPARQAQRAAQQEQARVQAQADAVARAERRRAASQAEIDAGRCSDAHHAALERALAALKPILEGSAGSDTWLLVAQDYVVATDAGEGLVFSARVHGEYQILVLGIGSARLEVRDGQGYLASRPADRAANTLNALANDFARDTRAVQANAGDKLQVTVKGAGCSLVFVFVAY